MVCGVETLLHSGTECSELERSYCVFYWVFAHCRVIFASLPPPPGCLEAGASATVGQTVSHHC